MYYFSFIMRPPSAIDKPFEDFIEDNLEYYFFEKYDDFVRMLKDFQQSTLLFKVMTRSKLKEEQPHQLTFDFEV